MLYLEGLKGSKEKLLSVPWLLYCFCWGRLQVEQGVKDLVMQQPYHKVRHTWRRYGLRGQISGEYLLP